MILNKTAIIQIHVCGVLFCYDFVVVLFVCLLFLANYNTCICHTVHLYYSEKYWENLLISFILFRALSNLQKYNVK